MKKEPFDEPLNGVREGGSILRGERQAARTFSFEKLDVRLAKECAKLQRPVEQAAAEEAFLGESEWPEY